MINLNDYDIHPIQGFLPAEDPLQQLPIAFSSWDEISKQIPSLLIAGKTRTIVKQMEQLKIAGLQHKSELWRAFLVLSVIANAYIMGEGEQAKILPANIAVPLWEVAQKLNIPPVFIYASMMLNNWSRIDISAPIDLDNLAILRSYYGGADEHWFFLSMVAIEAKGGIIAHSVVKALQAVKDFDSTQIELCLTDIIAAQQAMLISLKRVPEKCDPYVFYHRVRPILDAWQQPGVIYEGVSNKPQMWIAASAAQCALIQVLDITLGINHAGAGGKFLREMRHYMPKGHRQFLHLLESEVSLRDYILTYKQQSPVLKDLYNESVLLLDAFRKKHTEITVRYVLKPAQDKGTSAEYGTSGTDLSYFLGQVRKETSLCLIP